MGSFSVIEHTADTGISIEAGDLADLFKTSAEGMFSLITDVEDISISSDFNLKLQEDSLEDLFAGWLKELLFKFDTQRFLPVEYNFHELKSNFLKATIRGGKFDLNEHAINMEIKAVTYHELKVQKTDSGWRAHVIFDI